VGVVPAANSEATSCENAEGLAKASLARLLGRAVWRMEMTESSLTDPLAAALVTAALVTAALVAAALVTAVLLDCAATVAAMVETARSLNCIFAVV